MDVKQSIMPYFKWAFNIKYEYHTIVKPESDKAPESHPVLTPHTVSQPCSECLQAVRSFVPPLPSTCGLVGLVSAWCSGLFQTPAGSLEHGVCVWSGELQRVLAVTEAEPQNTQKKPPKATVLMGTHEEKNPNTSSSEMCSYLSISSIYRSSTIITQFKFSWEKAVFRMSFTISPKYTFCSGRFMHDAVQRDSLQCTIFLHTLAWHKGILGYVTVMATWASSREKIF